LRDEELENVLFGILVDPEPTSELKQALLVLRRVVVDEVAG